MVVRRIRRNVMPDPIVPPPPPTRFQRFMTALLPQFIAYSRKGLIWFSTLTATGMLELAKQFGQWFNWTDAQALQWSNRMMLIQGVILLVAKFWTQQIADEDRALKTGLPPPPPVTAGNLVVQAPPAVPPKPEDPAIRGLPPRRE
jgi:hypothetical protein